MYFYIDGRTEDIRYLYMVPGAPRGPSCLLLYLAVGNSLIFPMTLFLCLTCQIRRREAGQ